MTDTTKRRVDRRELIISLALMVVFDIGVNLLLFSWLRSRGVSELVAYLAGALGPVLSLSIEFARHRRLSRFSLFVIVLNVLGAALTFIGSTEGRWLIVKDSCFTGGIGLVFLASLAMRRPMMFWFGQKFGTDGSDEGVAAWNALWQYPSFRRSQRVITVVWGVSFVAEAVVRVVAALTLDFDRAYLLGQLLPLAVFAVCLTFTIVYARRVRREGEARGRAREAREAQQAAEAQTRPADAGPAARA